MRVNGKMEGLQDTCTAIGFTFPLTHLAGTLRHIKVHHANVFSCEYGTVYVPYIPVYC